MMFARVLVAVTRTAISLGQRYVSRKSHSTPCEASRHCLTVCAVSASLSFFTYSAQAAEITHGKLGEDVELILLKGEVKQGDDLKFKNLALRYPKAAVALDSPGGLLVPSLEIGKLIRMRGYATVVIAGDDCVSSCGLIWLAGTPRLLSRRGRVGFHASYLESEGKVRETGVGNALVGHYLSLLNLSQNAVIFATSASPDRVTWLSRSTQARSGIEFKDFEDAEKSAPDLTVRSRPVSRRGSASETPEGGPSWKVSAWSDEAVTYVDTAGVKRTGTKVRFWMQFHMKEPWKTTGTTSFTSLREVDCSSNSFVDLATTYYVGGKPRSVHGRDDEVSYAAPDTVNEGVINAACKNIYLSDEIAGDLHVAALRILRNN